MFIFIYLIYKLPLNICIKYIDNKLFYIFILLFLIKYVLYKNVFYILIIKF